MRRKTTVYLDDELIREVKVEAAQRRMSFSDVLEEALRRRGEGNLRRRPLPEWAGSFSSTEVTGASSEDVLRAELGRPRQ